MTIKAGGQRRPVRLSQRDKRRGRSRSRGVIQLVNDGEVVDTVAGIRSLQSADDIFMGAERRPAWLRAVGLRARRKDRAGDRGKGPALFRGHGERA